MEFFKIVKNLSGVAFVDVLDYANDTGTRKNNNVQLQQKFNRTTLGLNSYFSRNIGIWNDLPQHIVDAPTAISFKERLAKHDLSSYLVCFPNHYI